jgi:short-subunit dehydrogenase
MWEKKRICHMSKTFEHPVRGRTAVITGASSGIGEAFARRLAREGYNLLLVARRKELLAKLALELEYDHHVTAVGLAADLSDEEGVRKIEKRISGDDAIEVLINSAGFGTRGFFAAVETEKSQNMTYLHTMAVMRLTRAVLPNMIKNRRGYIIQVSSIGAFLTTSHYVLYSATKAFVNMFTRGLAEELAGSGVRVQALCPGLTKTGFMYTEEFSDFSYAKIPERFWMSPDRVVEESLAAIGRNKLIFIPGRGNRIFVRALHTPVIKQILGFIFKHAGSGLY